MHISVTSSGAIRRTALDKASSASKEDISRRGNVGAHLVMCLKQDGPGEPKIREVVQNFADATIRDRSSGGTSPVMERNTTLSERRLRATAATQDPVSPPASTFAGASRVREPEITASPAPPEKKTSHPVNSEPTDRRPAALLDNFASKRRVWPGDKRLTPPAQRPMKPDSASASSRAASKAASSLDQYDINVIVLTASDNTMTAAAQALSKKYPRKTVTLYPNGKIVADDIPGFREGEWSPPFHSKVKLQVLGHSRLAPMTGPGGAPGAAAQMMTIGGHSGGALGKILPGFLKKNLGISLTDACLNTSFVTCGSSGESSTEVGLEKAFVEAYIDGLRQGGQVSLANNFVSIHTAEVAVAADGTKYTRRIGSDVEQIGENTWVTTEREKRVYRYSASNIKPLGFTPAHYSKTALIDYAEKRQHMKFSPNPKNLTIYVMSQQHWFSIVGKNNLIGDIINPETYHQGEGRTLFILYDEEETYDTEYVLKYVLKEADVLESEITFAEAKTVVAEARGRGQTQFDLVLRGHGSNTIRDTLNK